MVTLSSRQRHILTGLSASGLGVVLIVIGISFAVTHFRMRQQVQLGAMTFTVRLAETDFARKKGLSGIETLGSDEGLLMVFGSDGFWGIWMKDMKIPLDIVWLDNNKKVIDLVTDVSPSLGTTKTFEPSVPARYVLEIPAGAAKKSAIKNGDTAEFKFGGEK